MAHPRVASLLASATEIVAALGAADLLVARSHECDFPPEIAHLPVVTAAQIDTNQPSGAIDREVKALLSRALSIYRVDGEGLRAVAPDLVVTQTQCEVCAVTPADVEAALAAWTGARPRLVSLAPNALADIFADIERVAAALGRPRHGAALVENLRARMEAIATETARLDARPRVACLEWIDPLMAAGNWVPELVAMAGGENLFGAAGRHSPWMSLEELAAADPDVILVLPCGFDIARTRRELPALTRRAEWGGLQAVRDRRIFLCDGNQYFNRPGPRVAESLEILAEILHPARFNFGHQGSGWIRLPETAEVRP
ncbi:MAG TPA: cobalamin-binding protein [Alphaproteobacteria bacterium]|nr:cobalamin-binding protein [Alphaproteobacteria bacterium]